MRLFLVVLSYLLWPIMIIGMYWRSLKSPNYRERMLERFGKYEFSALENSIWLHAVSVGEVQAAIPLIKNLQRLYPDTSLVVTTQTPTGSQRVQTIFGDEVIHVYVPFDIPYVVKRFMRHMQPKLAVIMETEIWPNLYYACKKNRIPLVIASARISPRSIESYRRFSRLFKSTLQRVDLIAAQTSRDAGRFIDIGADSSKVKVIGNLKFDFMFMPSNVQQKGKDYRKEYFSERPVWIAASTHEGEEKIVLDVYSRLLEKYPDLVLILVPRHPERFNGVSSLIESFQLRNIKRSSGEKPENNTQVLLVDTLGELPMFYAASDFTFVGGSLVPIGGHNLLEPAALSIPMVVGQHTFNAPEITEMLEEVKALQVINSADALHLACLQLLADKDRLLRAGASGKQIIKENHGALQRILEEIKRLFPPKKSDLLS